MKNIFAALLKPLLDRSPNSLIKKQIVANGDDSQLCRRKDVLLKAVESGRFKTREEAEKALNDVIDLGEVFEDATSGEIFFKKK